MYKSIGILSSFQEHNMLNEPSLANSSSWAPVGETSSAIFSDSIDLISLVLCGVAYGVVLPLYSICAYELWIQYRNPEYSKKIALLHLGYFSVLLILLTMYLAGMTKEMQIAYVDERNYPLGPAVYADLIFNLPGSVMTLFAMFAVNWLTDIILIWRLYTVYGGTKVARVVVILPTLMLMGSFVLSLITIGESVHGGRFFWSLPSVKFIQVGYYALSVSATIYSTGFILVRLISAKKQAQRNNQSGLQAQYLGATAILVESSALYTIWNIVYLGLYLVNSSSRFVLLDTLPAIQMIALLLIIYRVSRGTACTRGTTAAIKANEIGAIEIVKEVLSNDSHAKYNIHFHAVTQQC